MHIQVYTRKRDQTGEVRHREKERTFAAMQSKGCGKGEARVARGKGIAERLGDQQRHIRPYLIGARAGHQRFDDQVAKENLQHECREHGYAGFPCARNRYQNGAKH